MKGFQTKSESVKSTFSVLLRFYAFSLALVQGNLQAAKKIILFDTVYIVFYIESYKMNSE